MGEYDRVGSTLMIRAPHQPVPPLMEQAALAFHNSLTSKYNNNIHRHKHLILSVSIARSVSTGFIVVAPPSLAAHTVYPDQCLTLVVPQRALRVSALHQIEVFPPSLQLPSFLAHAPELDYLAAGDLESRKNPRRYERLSRFLQQTLF